MPGQDNSVCSGDTSKAEMSAEIRDDAAADDSTWTVDGRDRIPVRLVRHGGRTDSERGAADHPSASLRDGVPFDHADGFHRLARFLVAQPHQMAAGHYLP